MAQPTAERVGRNEAIFRRANERIEEYVRDVDGEWMVPFICECAEESCTTTIALTLDEYEHVRRDASHFVCVPGHEAAAGPWGVVVARRPRFVVVEKLGKAAQVAEAMDERASAGG
jgi:hypothetical protein